MMKIRKLILAVLALCLTAACFACTEVEPEPVPPEPEVVYGLPAPAIGHYITNADLLEDAGTRYLTYTTNEESGEEDNVIAVRKATFTEGEDKGWAYGDEQIVLRGDSASWDRFIGSASIVKGEFALGDKTYSWLMAYCATAQTTEAQYQIGLAVAETPDGTWTKVSDRPIVAFDGDVYGATSVGCYAPSLVNLNRQSVVRVFYTYADMYGHFAKFVDLNAADLAKLYTEEAENDYTLISGTVQLPTNGNISGGDTETMFPNADFVYDAENAKVYAVKDYSPSAGTRPMFAEKLELTAIAEEELYTAELKTGWQSVRLWDMTDTPDMAFERLYSASAVSDAYGQLLDASRMEIVYNVCEVAADNADWMFTQKLLTFEVELN